MGDRNMTHEESGDLDAIISRIEAKLDILEAQRAQIDEEIRLERGRVEEMENAIDSLRRLQVELD